MSYSERLVNRHMIKRQIPGEQMGRPREVTQEFTAFTYKQGPAEERTMRKGERLAFLRYSGASAIFFKVHEIPIPSKDNPAHVPGYIVEREMFDKFTRVLRERRDKEK